MYYDQSVKAKTWTDNNSNWMLDIWKKTAIDEYFV